MTHIDQPIWERDCVVQVLPSGCMIWMGAARKTGYGAVTYKQKRTMPHRIAYMQAYGPAPEGMHVCHRCDVRTCINPDHLFLGTPTDNAQDCVAKGRRPRGTKHVNSKITEEQLLEICELISKKVKKSKIGRKFGVSGTSIHNIAIGKTWGHATRGLLSAAILAIASAIGFQANAQETYKWNTETHITIQNTDVTGAEAEVVFLNSNIHPLATETFEITLGDLTVTVLFERDVQGTDDRFTVTPPPGYIAIPPELIVPENAAGRIVIYEGGLS